jgi:hypothetical protein
MQSPNIRGSLTVCISAGSFGLIDAMALILGQSGHGQAGIDRFALKRFGDALGQVLRQRRHDKWRAFEAQPLPVTNHTIDEGSIQKLPGSTNQMPAEPAQPATIMQNSQETLSIGAVPEQ